MTDTATAGDVTTRANYSGPMPSRVGVADGFYWLDGYRLLPITQYIMLANDYKFPEVCAGCFRMDKIRPVHRTIDFRFDADPFSYSIRFFACGKCQAAVRNQTMENQRQGRTADQGFRDFPLRFQGLRVLSKPGLSLVGPNDRLIAFLFPSVDYAVQFLALNNLWPGKCEYIKGHADPWHGQSEHWVSINPRVNKSILVLRREGIENQHRSHFGSQDDADTAAMTFDMRCSKCGATSAFDPESLAVAGDEGIPCIHCGHLIGF